MELDPEICRISDLQKEKSNSIHHRWNCYPGWKPAFMVMVLYRTSKQFCAWNFPIRREKHACCWKIHRSLIDKYGKHTVYTDGGTWYPEACNVLGLKHCLHCPLEKSLMERVNQYFKDRIESFDDYYPCIRNECNLFHVYNWIQFFVSIYNNTIYENDFIIQLQQKVNIVLN